MTESQGRYTQPRSREFDLGDILSITDGKLVSPRHMNGVYDILNFMTGDNLFAHQLPRASKECRGPLLLQLPQLRGVGLPEGEHTKDSVEEWLESQKTIFGDKLTVWPLEGGHEMIDPITEFLRIRMED